MLNLRHLVRTHTRTKQMQEINIQEINIGSIFLWKFDYNTIFIIQPLKIVLYAVGNVIRLLLDIK